MKTRNIKELLTLLLNNQSLFSSGLCSWASSLFLNDYITLKEYETLREYIDKNRPSKFSSISTFTAFLYNSAYYWEAGKIEPRIKWLKKHIKKNTIN